MSAETKPASEPAARLRTSNVRTAVVLGSIAAVFFFGVIATRWMGGYETGVSVLGLAVLLFLVFAIGRNLREKK